VGEGFSPARVRRASYDGVLDLECRRALARATPLTAELGLVDGRRADFSGVVDRVRDNGFDVRLEVEAADVPFFHAWVDESADPSARGAEPVRLARAAPEGAATSASSAAGDLDALWDEAAEDLEDDAKQQRFIQTCLASGQLELAVRRYRALKESRPEDPRPQRYLQQVGTILGFYALKQDGSAIEETGLSRRLKLALAMFVLAALVLGVIASVAG
jgi:hypothetical protein